MTQDLLNKGVAGRSRDQTLLIRGNAAYLAGDLMHDRASLNSTHFLSNGGTFSAVQAMQLQKTRQNRSTWHAEQVHRPCADHDAYLRFSSVCWRLGVSSRNFNAAFLHGLRHQWESRLATDGWRKRQRNMLSCYTHLDGSLAMVRLERVFISMAEEQHGRERMDMLRDTRLFIFTLCTVNSANINWPVLPQFFAQTGENGL